MRSVYYRISLIQSSTVENFRNKLVVITGGASGIGRAMAEAFGKEAARLVIADIEAEPLGIAERELRNAGLEVLAVQTDVADPGSVDGLANATLKAFGRVDIVCNNAGIGQSLRPVWEFQDPIGSGSSASTSGE